MFKISEENIPNQTKILCACGCGELINRYYMSERHLRERKYKHSHYWRGRRKPFDTHGENNSNWKGGRYLHSAGYILIKKPDHPRADKWGYVFEHIIVLEQKLGRYLLPEEDTHHINGVRNDNRPENLTNILHSEHARHHHTTVKPL